MAYSWTIMEDPTGEAYLTDPNSPTPTFHAPPVESDTEVIVALTVEDERGATATDTAVVNTLAVPAAPPKYELSISIVPLEGEQ